MHYITHYDFDDYNKRRIIDWLKIFIWGGEDGRIFSAVYCNEGISMFSPFSPTWDAKNNWFVEEKIHYPCPLTNSIAIYLKYIYVSIWLTGKQQIMLWKPASKWKAGNSSIQHSFPGYSTIEKTFWPAL